MDDLWLTWDLDIRKSYGHFFVEKLLIVVLALDIRVQVAVVVGANLVVRAATSLVDGGIFLSLTSLCWHNSYLVTHSRRSSNLCLYLSLKDDCISPRWEWCITGATNNSHLLLFLSLWEALWLSITIISDASSHLAVRGFLCDGTSARLLARVKRLSTRVWWIHF